MKGARIVLRSMVARSSPTFASAALKFGVRGVEVGLGADLGLDEALLAVQGHPGELELSLGGGELRPFLLHVEQNEHLAGADLLARLERDFLDDSRAGRR